MVFAGKFDAPYKARIERHKYKGRILSYEQWNIYKKEHKQEYTSEVGQEVERYVNETIKTHINLETCDWQDGKDNFNSWDESFKALINEIYYVVFGAGFNRDISNNEQMAAFVKYADDVRVAPADAIKKDKNKFVNNIIKDINKKIYPQCGYREFKQQKEAKKQESLQESQRWLIQEVNQE